MSAQNTAIATVNTSLVKLEQSLTVKSAADFMRLDEQAFLLVDVSGSMGDSMRNGKSKIAACADVCGNVQTACPTPMIAFGLESWRGYPDTVGFVDFCPTEAMGGTPLAHAIDFAKMNGASRVVVISDGLPDSQDAAIESARRFGGRIDVVYVGDAGDGGSFFLDRLAALTGGERFEGDLSQQRALEGKITLLLTA